MPTQPSKQLETFVNPNPERDYTIEIRIPEFTCLCPKTGQPDFATLYLDYIPDQKCIELKSLKLYIWSFRNEGAFHEAVTNSILNDLVAATAPRYMRLRAEFYVRGGIYTTIIADHRKPGCVPLPPPPPVADGKPKAGPEDPSVSADPAGADSATLPMPAAPPSQSSSSGRTGSGRFRMLPRERRTPPRTPKEAGKPESALPPAAEREPGEGVTARGGARKTAAVRAAATDSGIYLGIDLGSTGCRAMAIDAQGNLLAQADAAIPLPSRKENEVTQEAGAWWTAAVSALRLLAQRIDPKRVRAIAVDGTSGTLLLCDREGAPTTTALMYNDARAVDEAKQILPFAGPDSGAQGATSSLAKLLWLHAQGGTRNAAHALHQADWIAGKLTGAWGHSDYNNCLKLGYDTETRRWPDWISQLGINIGLLPQVHSPGEPLAPVSGEVADAFGFPRNAMVVAGTTDGVAAFIAAGGSECGDAVTSLGSTLVLKVLADRPVFSAGHGVYSHRLGDRWLIGGASNSGGATLLQYFKLEQLREMTPLLDPENLTGLEYYPLPDVGERFPVNDPTMTAKLEPLPADSVTFFQGMLEGIAQIEAQGYRLLHALGGPRVRSIRTTGGGSRNPGWQRIREQVLDVPLVKPRSELSAFGSALLAAGLFLKTA